MFFSTYVLTKKGPLAKVWLAAHWDRRLTRNEVKVMDLSQTIVHIVHPVVPIALRTSGELLVGVVRIYALKVRHLLKEATDATLFLRVTTVPNKSHSHSRGAANEFVDKDGNVTTVDGVLVGKGGDVEAVTFDWHAEAGKHGPGAFPDAAEALAEARFDAISDLLSSKRGTASTNDLTGSSGRGGAAGSASDNALASAWYALEPSSQAVEELHNTQQDYDEIARMRADLMAFGDRDSGSKSSLSSMEKGRGSAALDNVPLPLVTDDFDIGVPLPDELPSGYDPLAPLTTPQVGAEDPFALPEMLPEELAGHQAAPRRKRAISLLDLANTTLPPAVFEGWMASRTDIVQREPRRGPLDSEEARDRFTIAGTVSPADPVTLTVTATASQLSHELLSIADAAPLSHLANPALRVLYASVLHQSVVQAVEEAIQHSQDSLGAGRRSELAAGGLVEDELDELRQNEENGRGTRGKRPREEGEAEAAHEDEHSGALSMSAVKTLGRIQEETAHAMTSSRKRHRKETASALVGATCAFSAVASSLHRRDAARAFVDVLTLASKQYIGVRQEGWGADVEITLKEASAAVGMTA